MVVFRFVDLGALFLVFGLYVFFTVFFWGTFYYHLRTGAPKTNFVRFWRLVLENPDSTSGNFLEQIPKALLALFMLEYLLAEPLTAGRAGLVLGFTIGLAIAGFLIHGIFFDWKPVYPTEPTRDVNGGEPLAKRVIVVVIDGCRLDRFHEAEKPYLEKMMAGGTVYDNVETTYPARTVVCFSSMFTGAPPEKHGITSNLVLKLGLRVESIFDSLRRAGKKGRLVGIAHLIDSFGDDVASVTSVAHNDKIDQNLIAAAKRELEEHDPELLVLQLLAVDQNGHVRGTYYPEYVERIAFTDRLIEEFMQWCEKRGYLDEASAVVLMADHGQGRGIGAHGHLSEGERYVPFAMWGSGVAHRTDRRDQPASILDLAPTISYLLGIKPPEGSTGRVLKDALEETLSLLAVVVPVKDEEETIGELLDRISTVRVPGRELRTFVVDDGCIDRSAEIAGARGATVIRHPYNRGLGAAVRTGLRTAVEAGAVAVAYLDADLEYFPEDIPNFSWNPCWRAGRTTYSEAGFGAGYGGMKLHRRLGNYAFTALLVALTRRFMTDGQTGMRAFSREAADRAEIIHDYNYAQVLTLDLVRKGFRIKEVPIRYRVREHGESFIRWSYPAKVLPAIWRETEKSLRLAIVPVAPRG